MDKLHPSDEIRVGDRVIVTSRSIGRGRIATGTAELVGHQLMLGPLVLSSRHGANRLVRILLHEPQPQPQQLSINHVDAHQSSR